MFDRKPDPLPAETKELLALERALVATPAQVRRRLLARAKLASAPGMSSLVQNRRSFTGRTVSLLGVAVGVVALAVGARHSHPGGSSTAESAAAVPASAPLSVVSASSSAVEPLPSVAPPLESPTETIPRSTGGARAPGPAEEQALIEAIRHGLAAHDYSRALTLIGEHSRRFPRGIFVEEREAMRIKALWSLGRVSQARALTTSFRGRYPNSVVLPSLERLVGSAP